MQIIIQITEKEIRACDTDAITLLLGRAITPRRALRQLMGAVEIVTPPVYWHLPQIDQNFLAYCRKLRGRIPHFLFFASLSSNFYFQYFLSQSRSRSWVEAAAIARRIPIELGVFAGITSTEKRTFERFAVNEAQLRPDQAAERFATIAQYLRSGGNSL